MEIRINQAVLDKLTMEAVKSPSMHMHMDLRNNVNDQSQRMVIAIEPGSEVPIHRHQKTSETLVCLRGKIVVELYDDLERICTDSIILTPNGQTDAINIPIGQWHTVHALDSGSIIMEVKDGPYEPLTDVDILK